MIARKFSVSTGRKACAAAVLCGMMLCGAGAWAQKPPTPANPVGWRGDGTGCYPEATPPVHWGRVSKSVLSLRTQARKPAGDAPGGQAPADGVIREWLVLGPIPVPDGVKPGAMNAQTLPGEPDLSPNEGDKSGALAWKLVKEEGALLDFGAVLGKEKDAIAYAHAYLWSPAGQTVVMQCNGHHSLRAWLNGKPVGKADESAGLRLDLALAKGWNRLLFKVGSGVTAGPPNDSWFIDPVLFGGANAEIEEKNFRWVTHMPGTSPAAPIVVGNRLFTVAEPDLLVCVNKDDGKILWVRGNSLFDAIPEAVRKAKPAFAEVEPTAKRARETAGEFAKGDPDGKLAAEYDKLRKDMASALRKLDAKVDVGASDVGGAGTVPSSDGTFVYVWFTSCVSACYDLDGNRKWIRFDGYRNFEHGFTSSPLLVDGKLILYVRDIVAIDAKSGAVAWTVPYTATDPKQEYPNPRFHGSLVAATIGGVKAFVTPNADIYRVSDGKLLWRNPALVIGQQIPSAVVMNGLLYRQGMDGQEWPPKNKGGVLTVLKLPGAATEPLKPEPAASVQGDYNGFPRYYSNWFISSPLVHDGLVYDVNTAGILTVYDGAAGKVLYQKWLALNQFEGGGDWARGLGASPTLAGKYIYLMGNYGTTLVLKPGRSYEQVAVNRTEFWVQAKESWRNHVERTQSCPVFDGKRMYYRGEVNLYCIEEKP